MLHDVMDSIGRLVLGPEKYRAFQYKQAKKLARRSGYEIYKSHMIWFDDPVFKAALEMSEARGIKGIPNDRCYMLVELARMVKDVPGDTAECGSFQGKSSLFVMMTLGPDTGKTVHIFDSFAGLSEPTGRDLDGGGATVWAQGEMAITEDTVKTNLRGFEGRFETHKGWIPDRFGDVADARFCLAHIDVDLFEPTWDSIDFFYPRMNPGGVIVCDDYGSGYCPGAKRAFDEFFADKPEKVLPLPTGQCFIVKQ